MEVQGNLQSLLDGYNRINAGIEERCRTLQSYVTQQREIAAKVEESTEFLNKIQEDVRALNKPIGFRPEDTQTMLNSYELLLAELRVYREKMEDLQHRTTGNSGDLAAIVKQQDDLISTIEGQIKKLRHLLLLRQQFMALVAEITTFIAKYNEVVQDIEKGGKTAQEKIRRYDDVSYYNSKCIHTRVFVFNFLFHQQVIYKIQECEGQLATAQDKGEQIAAEGSVTDRNTITEQLTSLKHQLSALRRAVEQRRGEHENAAAEFKRLAGQIDELLDKMHEQEAIIRCRPLLQLPAESVEQESSKHKALAGDVKALLVATESLFASIPHDSAIPSTLQERISEATFLRDTLPTELASRGAYLEEQLALRSQYESVIRRLNNWMDEARLRLRPPSNGVDFEHIDKELDEHKVNFSMLWKLGYLIHNFLFCFAFKAYFNNEAISPQSLLDNIRTIADQILQSVDTPQQNDLQSEVNALSESVKNCLAAASDRQDQLDKDSRAYKEYEKSLEEVKQAIVANTQSVEETATNIPALKTLIVGLESKLVVLQVIS